MSAHDITHRTYRPSRERRKRPSMKPPTLENTTLTTSQLIYMTSAFVVAGLIGYFLLMQLLELHKILVLRTLNVLFLGTGIFLALRYFHNNKSRNGVPYFSGFRVGLAVTLYSGLTFALFMYVYLSQVDSFMYHIQQVSMVGDFLTPSVAAAGILIEALASGLIITFACMQLYKKN